jgi:hypothetical protein
MDARYDHDMNAWRLTPLDRPGQFVYRRDFGPESVFPVAWAVWSTLPQRIECVVRLHVTQHTLSALYDTASHPLYRMIRDSERVLLSVHTNDLVSHVPHPSPEKSLTTAYRQTTDHPLQRPRV